MSPKRGSLLIVTLWLVAVLSMLSIAISQRMSMELRLVRYDLARARAQALARGSVRYAAALLRADRQDSAAPYDWLGEAWAFNPDADREPAGDAEPDPTAIRLEVDGSVVELRVVDEERKLDINRVIDPVYRELLGRLLGRQELIDRALDYVDPDEEPSGADGLEEQDSPPYVAKNAPIVRLEELRQIPGLFDGGDGARAWPALRQRVSAFLTSVSRVNLNTAPREVLDAVFGDPAMAEAVLAFRWDPGEGDPQNGNRFAGLTGEVQLIGTDTGIRDLLTPLLTGPLGNVLGVQSERFTISTITRLQAPAVEYHLEAVISRDGETGAPQLIAWNQS